MYLQSSLHFVPPQMTSNIIYIYQRTLGRPMHIPFTLELVYFPLNRHIHAIVKRSNRHTCRQVNAVHLHVNIQHGPMLCQVVAYVLVM